MLDLDRVRYIIARATEVTVGIADTHARLFELLPALMSEIERFYAIGGKSRGRLPAALDRAARLGTENHSLRAELARTKAALKAAEQVIGTGRLPDGRIDGNRRASVVRIAKNTREADEARITRNALLARIRKSTPRFSNT